MNHKNKLLRPWAKFKKDDSGRVAWRSLIDHSLDVAAVCNKILENPIISRRLACLIGYYDLSVSQRARLAIIAGMHDLGKTNLGFQNRINPEAFPKAGHLGDFLSILKGSDDPQAKRIIKASRLAELVDWFEGGEENLIQFLIATISHHGHPVEPLPFRSELWRKRKDIDPIAEIDSIMNALLNAYPEACKGEKLPNKAPFVHAIMGLVTLADWIGSDTRFFPLIQLNINQDPNPYQRTKLGQVLVEIGIGVSITSGKDNHEVQINNFAEIFKFNHLYPTQQALNKAQIPQQGSIFVLEAETGSGKTEAALMWFLRLYYAGCVEGLYFALPTRVAAVQIYERVVKFVKCCFGDKHPSVVLAVPGYLEANGVKGQQLPDNEVLWPDSEKERLRYRGWAAEHRKRYFAGRIVIGTIDQVLLSALQVTHSHMRAFSLLRHLLVIDEVHASDAYMMRICEEVLNRHLRAGGHALLMSATLGESARVRLLWPGGNKLPGPKERATQAPYPVLWWHTGGSGGFKALSHYKGIQSIEIKTEPIMEKPEEIAQLALQAVEDGARVAILRNTVNGAIKVQKTLEACGSQELLFNCKGLPVPHHGRFARCDRMLLDDELIKRLKEDRPVVVAATQTLEQSLDIDFDLLITDLCPMDVFLQRLGRLHRHERRRPSKFKEPLVIVLIPEKSLNTFLNRRGEGRGPGGIGTVYEDLGILQATLEILTRRRKLHLPEENRTLIEMTTHPEALEQQSARFGELWKKHWSIMWGGDLSKRNTAAINLVDWFEPIDMIHFSDLPAKIRTRLGEDDRIVRFDEAPLGPFGKNIEYLTIPGHLAQGTESDTEIDNIKQEEEGFTFNLGRKQFRYDRLGLRPETK